MCNEHSHLSTTNHDIMAKPRQENDQQGGYDGVANRAITNITQDKRNTNGM